MNEDEWYSFAYLVVAWIIGVITFFAIWVYSFISWGFLIGLAIGWLPALIGGFIIGIIWPAVLLVIVAAVLLLLLNS